jgi:hypothetical protein
MELYNFFTELIPESETDRYNDLKAAKNKIDILFGTSCSFLIRHHNEWSIIGQILGDDTNAGDLDLLRIFGNIEYTWFDVYYPPINNIKS